MWKLWIRTKQKMKKTAVVTRGYTLGFVGGFLCQAPVAPGDLFHN
jgi:hypothetical protein